jgi:hypothetical protein
MIDFPFAPGLTLTTHRHSHHERCRMTVVMEITLHRLPSREKKARNAGLEL